MVRTTKGLKFSNNPARVPFVDRLYYATEQRQLLAMKRPTVASAIRTIFWHFADNNNHSIGIDLELPLIVQF